MREGILEWNKAFEKIGFRDAIEVRQQENEDFDPEDINYNTFRWITTDQGFAMGPSRANPLTGEILDADIIFDASMVRFWREDAKLFRGAGRRAGQPDPGHAAGLGPVRSAGAGSADARCRREAGTSLPSRSRLGHERGCWRRGRASASAARTCSYELGMAAMALAAKGEVKPGEKVPDELIEQAIKEVTMHEVGHTLGLRHNFKASTMLKNEQLHDTSITRKQGLVGSVMDYAPINLAPKGVKQGDYFTHHHRALRLLGHRVRLQAAVGRHRRRVGRSSSEIAKRSAPRPATTTAPTRTCSAPPIRWSTSGTSAPIR